MSTASTESTRPSRRSAPDSQVQGMMDRASEALAAGEYFEAEQIADSALHLAWRSRLYSEMARICLPLQEARRQRRIAALESGYIAVYDESLPDLEGVIEPGCHVVWEPNVGADARRISEAALDQRHAVIAFAVEPTTDLGRQPVVVVGPTTIRTQVEAPEEVDEAWCASVIDALTEAALASLDRARRSSRLVDDLMDRLDALPESELLHQELAEMCRQAHREAVAAEEADRVSGRGRRRKERAEVDGAGDEE